MDGNRRWGKLNSTSIERTYNLGARNLKNIIIKAQELDVQQLTAFAFSTENWNRERIEIKLIFNLLEKFIRSEIVDINYNNIKFKLIGNQDNFKKGLKDIIARAEKLTEHNTGLYFNLAFNYGGEMDLVKSFNSLLDKKFKNKDHKLVELSDIRENLYSSDIKNFDFLIRTGGEKRISNFMLLQLTYSELCFTNLTWPEFDPLEFEKSLIDYSNRERRFGASSFKKSAFRKKIF